MAVAQMTFPNRLQVGCLLHDVFHCCSENLSALRAKIYVRNKPSKSKIVLRISALGREVVKYKHTPNSRSIGVFIDKSKVLFAIHYAL